MPKIEKKLSNKVIDETRAKIIKSYNEKRDEKSPFSSSSLISENADIDIETIKKSSVLYNTLLSCLLEQGSRLAKHSHESIMEDFRNKFGENSEDNKIEVFIVKNTDIDMKEFRDSADDSELEDY